jgi:hypothetical protein
MGDALDVPEPLLFYVLRGANHEIGDPKNLATFKIFLLDEAWLFIRNETIRIDGDQGLSNLSRVYPGPQSLRGWNVATETLAAE